MREVNTKIYEILRIPTKDLVEDVSQVIADNIVQKANSGEDISSPSINVSDILNQKADRIHKKPSDTKKVVVKATGARKRSVRNQPTVNHTSKTPKDVTREPKEKLKAKPKNNNLVAFIILLIVTVIVLLKFELI